MKGTLYNSSPVGLTIKKLVESRKKKATENQDSDICKIPCGTCDKSYVKLFLLNNFGMTIKRRMDFEN